MWIDQICIDQSNTIERNHQVATMSHIYSNAIAVVVWLIGLYRPVEPSSFSQSVSRWNEYETYLSLHPYFTRTWILQEDVLVQRIFLLCELDRVLPWKCLSQPPRSGLSPRKLFAETDVFRYLIYRDH